MSVAFGPRADRTTVSRLLLAYLELTKPRIVMLVVLTGVPALLMASPGLPPPALFWGISLGIVLAAASAASFNHYFDRDIDKLMRRTASRPLPAGILPPAAAVVLGLVLGALATATLLVFGNPLAALIGVASILYYALFYTVWLKRRTPQNIVIGGGAGASAPLIAWAAVTGTIGVPALLLAAIVFMWTPPHFWALSLYRREDYARAGIPMLPVTHGEPETRRQILVYTIALVPVTVLLWPLGVAGWRYGLAAILLGALFVALAWRLHRAPSVPRAVTTFRYSIFYLFGLFVALTADALLSRVL
jgi:protoheme IX farnesyltransferase